MNIIDSILNTIHLPFSKILKGYNSPSELVIPLLYNSGICDNSAELPLNADKKTVERICNNNYSISVKPSKKGPYIIAVVVLIILILLPFLPIAAVAVLVAYLINKIKYSKEIRGN